MGGDLEGKGVGKDVLDQQPTILNRIRLQRKAATLGSVTKVFTSLLLADAVHRGEVAPNQRLDSLIPGTATHPDGRPITLVDLATHTSGLPRVPPGLWRQALRNRKDPYSELTREQVVEALRWPPKRPAGRRGKPVTDWHLPALEGAGALRSTASDPIAFLRAHIHPAQSPLDDPIRTVLEPRRAVRGPLPHRAGLACPQAPGRLRLVVSQRRDRRVLQLGRVRSCSKHRRCRARQQLSIGRQARHDPHGTSAGSIFDLTPLSHAGHPPRIVGGR